MRMGLEGVKKRKVGRLSIRNVLFQCRSKQEILRVKPVEWL